MSLDYCGSTGARGNGTDNNNSHKEVITILSKIIIPIYYSQNNYSNIIVVRSNLCKPKSNHETRGIQRVIMRHEAFIELG